MAQIEATSVLGNTTRVSSPARWVGTVIAGSALMAICSHISIPLFFTPVPLTLQPFAVLLLGLLLDPGAAFAAMALYLAEGAVGLPVFTPQGPGGTLQLFGPTGGYLMSYPFVAALISTIYRRLRLRSFGTALIAAVAGNLVILAAGTVWMASVLHQQIAHVLSLSVVPFLPGDALKVCAAAAITTGWLRLRKIEEKAGR